MSYEGLEGMNKPNVQKVQKREKLVDQFFIDEYNKNIKKVDFIMSYGKDFEKFFGKRGQQRLVDGYKVMRKQLNELIKGIEVQASDDDRKAVDLMLKVLGEVLVFREINTFVRDITMQLAGLSMNWAEYCAEGCANMKLYATLLTRIVQQNMTILDYLNVSKRTIQRLESVFLQRPAAFVSSEHYKKALQKASE